MKSGAWVFVCGASGAGKDSVIAWAREALRGDARIVFSRRLVTRPALTDEHLEVSPAAFSRLRDAGALAWHWEAHGHAYGIPATCAADVLAGRIVVVNGSREHASRLAGQPHVRIALVTAPETLVGERLQRRAREPAEAIARRMARNAALRTVSADAVFDNSGELQGAGQALAAWLRSLAPG